MTSAVCGTHHSIAVGTMQPLNRSELVPELLMRLLEEISHRAAKLDRKGPL